MSFNPPSESLKYWLENNPKTVSQADIQLLENRLGGSAPTSFVEFLLTYGAVEFDDDIACVFTFEYDYPDRTEERTAAISFIKTPELALRYYEGLLADEDINLPSNLLPFGMDYGQSELLVEFGEPTERVFFWDFDRHDWNGGNTTIGYVAKNFYEFINNLKSFDDG